MPPHLTERTKLIHHDLVLLLSALYRRIVGCSLPVLFTKYVEMRRGQMAMCDANAMLCASFIPFDASLYHSFIGLGRVHPATKGWLRHGDSITPSLRSPLAPPAPFQHRLLPLPSAVRHGPSSLPGNEICFHSSTFFLSFFLSPKGGLGGLGGLGWFSFFLSTRENLIM